MSRFLALAFLAILSIHCTQATVSSEPLKCRIETVADSPTGLRFSLTNTTAAPLWVLRWNTPLEGWVGTILTVTANGTEVPYQGPMVKRADPSREDYIEIPAGETVSNSVDLSEAFEISKPGRYEVTVTGNLFDVSKDASLPRSRDRHEAMNLRCGAVTLEVTGRDSQ